MKALTKVETMEVAAGGFFEAVGHAIGYAIGYAAHEIEEAATSPAGAAAISEAHTSGAVD